MTELWPHALPDRRARTSRSGSCASSSRQRRRSAPTRGPIRIRGRLARRRRATECRTGWSRSGRRTPPGATGTGRDRESRRSRTGSSGSAAAGTEDDGRLRVRDREAGPRAVAGGRPAGAAPRGGRLRPRAAQARRHAALLPRRGATRTPRTRCSPRCDPTQRDTLVAVAEDGGSALRHPAAGRRRRRHSSRCDRVRPRCSSRRARASGVRAGVARGDARGRAGACAGRGAAQASSRRSRRAASPAACDVERVRLGDAAAEGPQRRQPRRSRSCGRSSTRVGEEHAR